MKAISWQKMLLIAAFALLTLGLTAAAGQALAAPAQEGQDAPALQEEKAADEVDDSTEYQTYVAVLPGASGGGTRVVSVRFFEDGTVLWDTQFHNGEPPIEEVGTWEDTGEGSVTVTITGQADAEYDEPATVVFQIDDDVLIATDYDKSMYGAEGLQLKSAVDVLAGVEASLITLDLAAGFPLDPTFMSVNAGGEVPATLLGAGCSGFINPEPVVTVNWSGDADFVEVFFVSNDDPTLVIMTPDGEILCNDDANDNLLDPVIEITAPVEGVYKIWVGSFNSGHLLPGVLVLTTNPEVNLGTFNLGGLIHRAQMPETLPEHETIIEEAALIEELEMAIAEATDLTEAELGTTIDIVADGDVPLFMLPLEAQGCAGLVTVAPSYTFDWQGEAETLRVMFEGDADSSLLVIGPDMTVVCADDSADGANQNPMVDVSAPATGLYAVYVGRISPEAPVTGVLSITDGSAEPETLAPASE